MTGHYLDIEGSGGGYLGTHFRASRVHQSRTRACLYVVPVGGISGQHRERLDCVYFRNTLSIPSDVHWGLRTTCTDGLFGASCVRVVFAVLALGNLANQASNGMFSPVWCARENQPEMLFMERRSRSIKVFSGLSE